MADNTNSGFLDILKNVIDTIGTDISVADFTGGNRALIFDASWFEPYPADAAPAYGMREEIFAVDGAQIRLATIPDEDLDRDNRLTLATVKDDATGEEQRFLLTPDGTVLFDFDRATGDRTGLLEGLGNGAEPRQIGEYIENRFGKDAADSVSAKLDGFARDSVGGQSDDPFGTLCKLRVETGRGEYRASDMFQKTNEQAEIDKQKAMSPQQAADIVAGKIEELKKYMTADEIKTVDTALAAGLVKFPTEGDGRIRQGNSDPFTVERVKDGPKVREIRTTYLDVDPKDFLAAGFAKTVDPATNMPVYELGPALKAISNAVARRDAVDSIGLAVHKSVSVGIDGGVTNSDKPSSAAAVRSFEERLDGVISTLNAASTARLVEIAGNGATPSNLADFLTGSRDPACGAPGFTGAYFLHEASTAPLKGYRETLGMIADKLERCGTSDIGSGPAKDADGNTLPTLKEMLEDNRDSDDPRSVFEVIREYVDAQKDPEVILQALPEINAEAMGEIRYALDGDEASNSLEKILGDYNEKMESLGYRMTDYGVYADDRGVSPDTRFTVREKDDSEPLGWAVSVVEKGETGIKETCYKRQEEIKNSGMVVTTTTPYDSANAAAADYRTAMNREGQRQFPLARISPDDTVFTSFKNFERAEKEKAGIRVDSVSIEKTVVSFDEYIERNRDSIVPGEGGIESGPGPGGFAPEGEAGYEAQPGGSRGFDDHVDDAKRERGSGGYYTGPDNDRSSRKGEGNFNFRAWNITATPHGISDAGKEALQNALDLRNRIGERRGFAGMQRYSPLFQIAQLRATCIAFRNGVQINGHTMTALDIFASVHSIYGLLMNPSNTIIMGGLSVILNWTAPILFERKTNRVEAENNGVETVKFTTSNGGTVERVVENGVTKTEDYTDSDGNRGWHRDYAPDKSFVQTEPGGTEKLEASRPDWHGDRTFEKVDDKGNVVAEGKMDNRGRITEEDRYDPVTGKLSGTTRAEFNKDGSSRTVKTTIDENGGKTTVEETRSAHGRGRGYELETKTTPPSGEAAGEKFGVDEKGHVFLKESIVYDRVHNDRPSRVERYDENGKVSGVTMYEYDADGRLTRTTNTDAGGRPLSTEEKSVDPVTGEEKTVLTKYRDGKVSETEITIRDRDGNFVRSETVVNGNVIRVTVPEPGGDGSKIVRDLNPDGSVARETVVNADGGVVETRFTDRIGKTENCPDGVDRKIASDTLSADGTRTVRFESEPDGTRISAVREPGRGEVTLSREEASGKPVKDQVYDEKTGVLKRDVDYDANGLKTVTYYADDGKTVTGTERFREDGTSRLERTDNGVSRTFECSAPDSLGNRVLTEDRGSTEARSTVDRNGKTTKEEVVDKGTGRVLVTNVYPVGGGKISTDHVNSTQMVSYAPKNGRYNQVTRELDANGKPGLELRRATINEKTGVVTRDQRNFTTGDFRGTPRMVVGRNQRSGLLTYLERYEKGVLTGKMEMGRDDTGKPDRLSFVVRVKGDDGNLRFGGIVTYRGNGLDPDNIAKNIATEKFRIGDIEITRRYNRYPDGSVTRRDTKTGATETTSLTEYRNGHRDEYEAGNRIFETGMGVPASDIEDEMRRRAAGAASGGGNSGQGGGPNPGGGQGGPVANGDPVKAVADKVEALKTDYSPDEIRDLDAALSSIRADFNALTDDQKAQFANEKLPDGTSAGDRLDQAQAVKDRIDGEAVKAVAGRAEALDPNPKPENIRDLDSALSGIRSDYGRLTDDQKTKLENTRLSDGTTVKDRLDTAQAAKDRIDGEAVKAVADKVEGLKTDYRTDEIRGLDSTLSDIRSGYGRLTDDQKTRLDNEKLSDGTTVKDRLDTAQAAKDRIDGEAVKAVADKIEKTDAGTADMKTVGGIRDEINRLTPDQKTRLESNAPVMEKFGKAEDTAVVKDIADRIGKLDPGSPDAGKVAEIRADIEKLTPGQRTLLESNAPAMERFGSVENASVVKGLERRIESVDLKNVDPKTVAGIRADIEKLTPEQKAAFESSTAAVEKLGKAEEALSSVKSITDRIEGLDVRNIDADKLNAIKSDIDKLTPEQRTALNGNSSVMEKLRDAEDALAVKGVSDRIEALDLKNIDVEKLEGIKADIDKLTPDQQSLLKDAVLPDGSAVTDRLEAAEKTAVRESSPDFADRIETKVRDYVDGRIDKKAFGSAVSEEAGRAGIASKTDAEKQELVKDIGKALAGLENDISSGARPKGEVDSAMAKIGNAIDVIGKRAGVGTGSELKAAVKEGRAEIDSMRKEAGVAADGPGKRDTAAPVENPRVQRIENEIKSYVNRETRLGSVGEAVKAEARGLDGAEKEALVGDVAKALANVERYVENSGALDNSLSQRLDNAKDTAAGELRVEPAELEKAIEAERGNPVSADGKDGDGTDSDSGKGEGPSGGGTGGGTASPDSRDNGLDLDDFIEARTDDYLKGNISREDYKGILGKELSAEKKADEEGRVVPSVELAIGRALARVEVSGRADEDAMKDIKGAVLEVTGGKASTLEASIEYGKQTDLVVNTAERYIDGKADRNELSGVFEKNKDNAEPVAQGIGEVIKNHREDIDSGKPGVLGKIRDIVDTAKEVIGDIAGKVAKYGVTAGIGMFALFASLTMHPDKAMGAVVKAETPAANRAVESRLSVDSVQSLREILPERLSVDQASRAAIALEFPETKQLLNMVEAAPGAEVEKHTPDTGHDFEKPEDGQSDFESREKQEKTDEDAIREAEKDLEAQQLKDVEPEKHDTADTREEDKAEKEEDKTEKEEDRQDTGTEKEDADKVDNNDGEMKVDNSGEEQGAAPPDPDNLENTVQDMEQQTAEQMTEANEENSVEARQEDLQQSVEQVRTDTETAENTQDLAREQPGDDTARDEAEKVTEPEPEHTDVGEQNDLETAEPKVEEELREDAAGDTREEAVVREGGTYQDAANDRTAEEHKDDDAADAGAMEEEPAEPKTEQEANTAAPDTEEGTREDVAGDGPPQDGSEQTEELQRSSDGVDEAGGDGIGTKPAGGDSEGTSLTSDELANLSDRVTDMVADLLTNSAMSYAAGDNTFSVLQEMTDLESASNSAFAFYGDGSQDTGFADAVLQLTESGTASLQDILDGALDKIEERGVPEGVSADDFTEGIGIAANDVAGAFSESTDPVTVGDRDFLEGVDYSSYIVGPDDLDNMEITPAESGMTDAELADSGAFLDDQSQFEAGMYDDLAFRQDAGADISVDESQAGKVDNEGNGNGGAGDIAAGMGEAAVLGTLEGQSSGDTVESTMAAGAAAAAEALAGPVAGEVVGTANTVISEDSGQATQDLAQAAVNAAADMAVPGLGTALEIFEKVVD